MGAGWMNLASLGLGLAAWLLPCIAIAFYRKAGGRLSAVFVAASGLCCALALYLQIRYQNHLVEIGDIIAILDTSEPLVFVAGVLLGVTAFLNAAALLAVNAGAKET